MPTRHGPYALSTPPPPHPRRSKNGSRHYVRTYSPAVWTPGRTPRQRAHRNIAAIHNDHATVINADTGEVLTEHTLEATRTYQRKNAGTPIPGRSPAHDDLRRHRVGVAGFEPTTSASRTRRATKLRHTPVQLRQDSAYKASE